MVVAAVNSVLKQTAKPHEIIVVDDASTDDTEDRLTQFGGQICIVQPDRNVERGGARNAGAATASGTLLAFLDSDDEWHPDKLERQLGAEPEGPSVTGVRVLETVRTRARTVIPPSDAQSKIFTTNAFFASPSSLMISRLLFHEVGGFPQEWAVQGSEDWVLLARLTKAGHRLQVIREPLVDYHVHEGNDTADPDRVAVSMWAAVETMRNEGLVAGAQLSKLRQETAIRIARGFATRGRVSEAAAWWRRGLQAGTPAHGARVTAAVGASLAAGGLRTLGLRPRI